MLKGFLVGALVGGVTTWLLLPQSGSQTRQMLREQGHTLKSSVDRTVEQAQDTAREQIVKTQTTLRAALPRPSETEPPPDAPEAT